jgi:DNA polymerase III subunit beta
MEFSLPRDDLADAVTHTAHGIPNNPLQPIRAGMDIQLQGDAIRFAASDGDVIFSSRVSYHGPNLRWERTVVPGKLFADVVRTLPDMPVHFVTNDITATLTCGRVKFKLPVYKEDYPPSPDTAEVGGNIDSDVFTEGIKKIIPAASRSDSNPALASVYLEQDNHTLWAVCTDRYRLAAVRMDWTPADMLSPVLIPSWALDRWVRDMEGPVTLGWDDRVATLTCSAQSVTSRVWGGDFPKGWRSLLPVDSPDVEVSTEDLLDALKRAQLASEGDSPVELTFSHHQLRVEAGYEHHSEDVLDATYNGDEFKALFGIKYLTDGLAGCGPVASFGWTTPDRPVWIVSGSYSYTILPRRSL